MSVRIEQNCKLQEEVNRLKIENDRLRGKRDQLEIQLENYLVGEDRGEGRIIHRAKNPLNECLKQREYEVEKLQAEVITNSITIDFKNKKISIVPFLKNVFLTLLKTATVESLRKYLSFGVLCFF